MTPLAPNLIVQVKNHKVMRVVPFGNEAVNVMLDCQTVIVSPRSLNSDDRLAPAR